MSPRQVLDFREGVLAWYGEHARDLPWRRTRDAYLIWVSEIMLQQTRVATVLDHYARFTARFPTVQALAAASEADVLAQWSGLGYYRRARMMRRAAQTVVAEHAGQFPRSAAALQTLPGIGAYTAAAVASIAFGEPVAAVDGNVERVLTRIAALEDEPAPVQRIRELAGKLLDPEHPSHFNQAMMELGATVCLPRAPLCLQCPVMAQCGTRGEHKTVPRKPQQSREAYFTLSERTRRGIAQVLLEQRPEDASLMAGMWQLPELTAAPEREPLCRLKHAITVTNYTVLVFANATGFRHDWPRRWAPLAEVPSLPLTGLARKALLRLDRIHGPHGKADSAGTRA